MQLLTSWIFGNTPREVLSCDTLPPDHQLGCAFAVPFFRDENAFRPILCHQTKRWREFPGGRRDSGETHAANFVREIEEEAGIVAREWCKLVCVRKFYNPIEFIMPRSGQHEPISYCAIYALVTTTPLVEQTAPRDEISDVAIVDLDDERLDQLTASNRLIYEQAYQAVREAYGV